MHNPLKLVPVHLQIFLVRLPPELPDRVRHRLVELDADVLNAARLQRLRKADAVRRKAHNRCAAAGAAYRAEHHLRALVERRQERDDEVCGRARGRHRRREVAESAGAGRSAVRGAHIRIARRDRPQRCADAAAQEEVQEREQRMEEQVRRGLLMCRSVWAHPFLKNGSANKRSAQLSGTETGAAHSGQCARLSAAVARFRFGGSFGSVR